MLATGGGDSDDGGFNPSAAGGLATTGGLQGGGGGQAFDDGLASCQFDTAGGAEVGVICSAAGGCVNGVGVIDATGAIVVEVGVIVEGDVGVSGGTGGIRLAGFKIWALWTVEPVPRCCEAVGFAWWTMWQARAGPGTPPKLDATKATNPTDLDQFGPIRWPHPCDAIMGVAILFLRWKNQEPTQKPGRSAPLQIHLKGEDGGRAASETRRARPKRPSRRPAQVQESSF